MGKVFTACVIAGMVAMSIGARAATFTVTCGASNSSYTFDLAHKTAGYPLPGLPYQVMPAHVTAQEIEGLGGRFGDKLDALRLQSHDIQNDDDLG